MRPNWTNAIAFRGAAPTLSASSFLEEGSTPGALPVAALTAILAESGLEGVDSRALKK
jgi:hypothetical protein